MNYLHNVNSYFAWEKVFTENILKGEFFLFIHTLTYLESDKYWIKLYCLEGFYHINREGSTMSKLLLSSNKKDVKQEIK